MEQELIEIAGDILEHPRFLELKESRHHGKKNNLYDHCVRTARCALSATDLTFRGTTPRW